MGDIHYLLLIDITWVTYIICY